jgi:hypothetical protein
MRKVILRTLCGAERLMDMRDAPRLSRIIVPMQIGTYRGATFVSGLEAPSLTDPPQIVTREFEYWRDNGTLPVYREIYAGPSQSQQTSERVIAGQNREIERLKGEAAALKRELNTGVVRRLLRAGKLLVERATGTP